MTKQFRQAIARIKANGETLATLTHETAVSMATHAKEHGDMTLFVDLFNALHTAQRRKAFLVWLHDFTPIRIKVKDDVALAKGSAILRETSKDFIAWNLEGLNAVKYWDYTVERDPVMLDASTFEKAIERLAKRLEKAIEQGKVSDTLDVDAAAAYLAKLAKVTVPDLTREPAPAASETDAAPAVH